MDAEAFARVRALFDAVADLDAEAREQCLRASGEGPDVLARVRSMLAASGATAEFNAPISAMLGTLAGAELAAGTRLGAWTLQSKVGEGGMGTVYAARRSDGHFDQDAAIKLLRGVPSAAALEYLARERQILASLTHPNIARLLDGGTTPQGQPYLVMEYLDGVPIDRYCREQRPDSAALLRLLIPVCEAVAYAHAHLVVHCDLKPSNILVRADGRPCLLDFGIARVLGDADRAQPSSISQRARAFTPGFASPEQEGGGSLTTAADIYSLGRLLEALLGVDRLAADAELAAIVARATRQLPAERYGSAELLAQDLERYLQRQPLAALPATLAYRSRKLLQRRWPAVAAVLAVLLLVAAFTLRLAIESERALGAERVARVAEQTALTQRDRARLAESAARQISEFLVSIFEASNPDDEIVEIPTSKLVEQAQLRLDGVQQSQPESQSDLYSALARVQVNMGQADAAKANFARAIDLERKRDRPLELAMMLHHAILLQISRFSGADAEPMARELVSLREQYGDPDSLEMAQAYGLLGHLLSRAGQRAEGEGYLQRRAALTAKIDAHNDDHAESLEALGLHYKNYADYPQAIAKLRESADIRSALAGDDNANTLDSLEWLANALILDRDFVQAEAILRRALRARIALHGERSSKVASVLDELARVLSLSGRTLEALPLHRQALAIAEEKLGRDNVAFCVYLNHYGLSLQYVGDDAGAEGALAEAVATLSKRLAASHQGLAQIRLNLGRLLLRMERLPEARAALQQALQTRSAGMGEHSPRVAEVRISLADLELRSGRPAVAARELDLAQPQVAELDELHQIAFVRQRALLAAQLGDVDSALADLEKVEARMFAAVGNNDIRGWFSMLDRAELLARRNSPGDRAASRAIARQILTQVEPLMVADARLLERLRRL